MEQMRLGARVAIALGVRVAIQAQIGDLGIHPPASRLNQPPAAENATLFLNVRVFDGRNTTLSPTSSVLVKENTIERVSTTPIDAGTIEYAAVINGQGRVLMPGLIDAHWHAFMAATPQTVLTSADASYLHLLAARQAEATLLRGFTTVREMGAPCSDLSALSTQASQSVRASILRAPSSRKPRDTEISGSPSKSRAPSAVRLASPKP